MWNSSWKCLLYKVSSLHNCPFCFSPAAQVWNALSETEGFHAYQPEEPQGLPQEAQPTSVLFHQGGGKRVAKTILLNWEHSPVNLEQLQIKALISTPLFKQHNTQFPFLGLKIIVSNAKILFQCSEACKNDWSVFRQAVFCCCLVIFSVK